MEPHELCDIIDEFQASTLERYEEIRPVVLAKINNYHFGDSIEDVYRLLLTLTMIYRNYAFYDRLLLSLYEEMNCGTTSIMIPAMEFYPRLRSDVLKLITITVLNEIYHMPSSS